jgi:hypothetical protein
MRLLDSYEVRSNSGGKYLKTSKDINLKVNEGNQEGRHLQSIDSDESILMANFKAVGSDIKGHLKLIKENEQMF